MMAVILKQLQKKKWHIYSIIDEGSFIWKLLGFHRHNHKETLTFIETIYAPIDPTDCIKQ